MDAASLAEVLAGPHPPLLLHVTPEEHFAACRISGARNVCVYETAFLDHVRALVSDHAAPIVVYGAGTPSLDSEEATRVLREAGYINVADFRGGLREWEAAGLPIISETPLPAPPSLLGVFAVDTAASGIRWTGRNLFNFHHGRISLTSGRVEWRDDTLQRATFVINLDSLVCEDIADPTLNAMLVAHLRSADFLDAARHPVATFETTRVDENPDATPGSPNFQITGNFTLRDVTHEISFPAVIAASDADHVTAQAQIEIDRTLWGSRYGSGKFFAFLGRHVVNDLVALHLKIVAARA
jgi:polyisoprenoid-binding protein YceI